MHLIVSRNPAVAFRYLHHPLIPHPRRSRQHKITWHAHHPLHCALAFQQRMLEANQVAYADAPPSSVPFRNEDPIPDRVDGRHHADAIGGLDSVHIGQEDVRQKRGIGVEYYKAEISAVALAGGESRVGAKEVGKAGAEETGKAVHGGRMRLLLECMLNVCGGDWYWDGCWCCVSSKKSQAR